MARPRSAHHDLRREAIVDVAAQCFARQSFPAASMNDIAKACGASTARLYHYFVSKEAILFDMLDSYTKGLLALIGEAEGRALRKHLTEREALHELVKTFLAEYENSATRHAALVSDTKFLGEAQREQILNRQRDVVAAFTRFLKRAYPERINPANQAAVTMMLFGMINWTFTWLRPGGTMSYLAFADEVVKLLEHGLLGGPPPLD